jgi:hypothetical protein
LVGFAASLHCALATCTPSSIVYSRWVLLRGWGRPGLLWGGWDMQSAACSCGACFFGGRWQGAVSGAVTALPPALPQCWLCRGLLQDRAPTCSKPWMFDFSGLRVGCVGLGGGWVALALGGMRAGVQPPPPLATFFLDGWLHAWGVGRWVFCLPCGLCVASV